MEQLIVFLDFRWSSKKIVYYDQYYKPFSAFINHLLLLAVYYEQIINFTIETSTQKSIAHALSAAPLQSSYIFTKDAHRTVTDAFPALSSELVD